MRVLIMGAALSVGVSCLSQPVATGLEAELAAVRSRAAARVEQIRATPDAQVPDGAARRYVSAADGDDAADGLTPRTAWRTIARLNRERLSPGAFVLFARGGVYRGTVKTAPGVTYASYGEGPKPCICGSPEDGADPARWRPTDEPQVWSYDIGHQDVGTLVFDDGAAHAIKIVYRTDAKTGRRTSLYTGRPFESYRDLDGDLHFWHDYSTNGTGRIYLRSARNPGERFRSIEFNVRCCGFMVGRNAGVTIDGFTVAFAGVHGVSATTCRDLTVRNCEFRWIGGSIQAEGIFGRDHPTRFGNGVEVYGGCDGYTVSNCCFREIYDAGVTHQLNIPDEDGPKRFDQRRVRYVDNVFERCNYSGEYFLTARTGNMSRMEDVLVQGNLMLDAGCGFCEQRPDRGTAGHFRAWYRPDRNRAKDFVIRGNVLCLSKDALLTVCSGLRNADGSSSLPRFEDNVVLGYRGDDFGTVSETSGRSSAFGPASQDILNAHGAGNRCVVLPRPEISWSIMHPTAIDVAYMRRVAEKARAYGGVDSFEVCGDCHSAYGGINGLSMLEPYPHAHAQVDPKRVEKARAELNAICEIAHSAGKPLYYWHREIFIPKGLLEDLPRLLDGDGEFDLLGRTYQDYLRFKLDEAFRYVPGLDGVVLTLTEADYSVIHNSNPGRYPPQKVVEQLVRLFAEEHARRGKRFILRSFGSNTQDYVDIIGGAVAAARAYGFEVETKVTEADFVPWLSKNPFLRKNPPLALGAECDALGEFLGAGYLPAAQVARIREYVDSCRAEGVDRYTIRIDRVGNSIFDSAHEVNLYAYMRFIRDPSATADGVIGEYADRRFGKAAERMAPLVKGELEMVRNIHYIASNLTFHSFPLPPDFKTVKAGGIFSLYRENSSLESTKDIWSILSWMNTPPHAQILAEKALGRRLAAEGLATVEALKGLLPADEYARQRRAFANAEKASRALEAYTKCVVAYFEDMSARRDDPAALRAASEEAVRAIESMMADVNAVFVRTGHFTVVGENLDLVYFAGLRFYCRELLREYRLERAQRAKLEARADVLDFVIPGGIYDDNRTIRTMHGAYSETKADRVVRYAGNPVFPNGTITVKLSAPQTAEIEVVLDADGASDFEMTKTWEENVWTVRIGKKGSTYPGVLSIAAVCPGQK